MAIKQSSIKTSSIFPQISSIPEQIAIQQREEHFVLDCVNSLSSKLQPYNSNRDHYLKPYCLQLLKKCNSPNKESGQIVKYNRGFKIRKKIPYMVGQHQFRNFLSERINKLNSRNGCQTSLNSAFKQIKAPLNSLAYGRDPLKYVPLIQSKQLFITKGRVL